MNKTEWITQTTNRLGADNTKETARIIDAAIESLTYSLSRGEEIRVPKFGTITTRKVKARKCRNPRTGESMKVPAKTKVVFRPASALAAAVQPKKRVSKPKVEAPAKPMKASKKKN